MQHSGNTHIMARWWRKERPAREDVKDNNMDISDENPFSWSTLRVNTTREIIIDDDTQIIDITNEDIEQPKLVSQPQPSLTEKISGVESIDITDEDIVQITSSQVSSTTDHIVPSSSTIENVSLHSKSSPKYLTEDISMIMKSPPIHPSKESLIKSSQTFITGEANLKSSPIDEAILKTSPTYSIDERHMNTSPTYSINKPVYRSSPTFSSNETSHTLEETPSIFKNASALEETTLQIKLSKISDLRPLPASVLQLSDGIDDYEKTEPNKLKKCNEIEIQLLARHIIESVDKELINVNLEAINDNPFILGEKCKIIENVTKSEKNSDTLAQKPSIQANDFPSTNKQGEFSFSKIMENVDFTHNNGLTGKKINKMDAEIDNTIKLYEKEKNLKTMNSKSKILSGRLKKHKKKNAKLVDFKRNKGLIGLKIQPKPVNKRNKITSIYNNKTQPDITTTSKMKINELDIKAAPSRDNFISDNYRGQTKKIPKHSPRFDNKQEEYLKYTVVMSENVDLKKNKNLAGLKLSIKGRKNHSKCSKSKAMNNKKENEILKLTSISESLGNLGTQSTPLYDIEKIYQDEPQIHKQNMSIQKEPNNCKRFPMNSLCTNTEITDIDIVDVNNDPKIYVETFSPYNTDTKSTHISPTTSSTINSTQDFNEKACTGKTCEKKCIQCHQDNIILLKNIHKSNDKKSKSNGDEINMLVSSSISVSVIKARPQFEACNTNFRIISSEESECSRKTSDNLNKLNNDVSLNKRKNKSVPKDLDQNNACDDPLMVVSENLLQNKLNTHKKFQRKSSLNTAFKKIYHSDFEISKPNKKVRFEKVISSDDTYSMVNNSYSTSESSSGLNSVKDKAHKKIINIDLFQYTSANNPRIENNLNLTASNDTEISSTSGVTDSKKLRSILKKKSKCLTYSQQPPYSSNLQRSQSQEIDANKNLSESVNPKSHDFKVNEPSGCTIPRSISKRKIQKNNLQTPSKLPAQESYNFQQYSHIDASKQIDSYFGDIPNYTSQNYYIPQNEAMPNAKGSRQMSSYCSSSLPQISSWNYNRLGQDGNKTQSHPPKQQASTQEVRFLEKKTQKHNNTLPLIEFEREIYRVKNTIEQNKNSYADLSHMQQNYISPPESRNSQKNGKYSGIPPRVYDIPSTNVNKSYEYPIPNYNIPPVPYYDPLEIFKWYSTDNSSVSNIKRPDLNGKRIDQKQDNEKTVKVSKTRSKKIVNEGHAPKVQSERVE